MLDDDELVLEREIDARRLLPVAQRGVEEIEAFACHHSSPFQRSARQIASASTTIFSAM